MLHVTPVAIAILIALALPPLLIGYTFLVANHVVPRLRHLPSPAARMLTALTLTLPWLVLVGALWVWLD